MRYIEQLEEEEKFEEAYSECLKKLPKKQDDIDFLTRTAHLALILDKKDDAKGFYARILEADPTSVLAHEQLMDLYVHEDKFKYYLLRGNLNSLQQLPSHAKNDYKKAIDNAKDALEALPARFLYAGICEAQEKNQDAIDEYLKILESEEKNPLVFLKLAELYEKTEGLIASIEILERGLKESGLNELEEVLAGYYIRNSQPEKAFELSKNSLTKARALMDLGKNDEAYDILKDLQEQFGNQALYHSLLAQYYFQKGMKEEAFSEIDEFAKIEPNSPLIYQMRALIYEDSEDAFNEHLNWGKYNILKGEKDVALNEFLTAYRFDSSDAQLVETIAVMLEEMKDNTKANEFYEKLSELEPKNTIALQKLADFRESIGDYSGAFDYIEKLKAIDPSNAYVSTNYEIFKDKAENGGGFVSFFKSIFGKRM